MPQTGSRALYENLLSYLDFYGCQKFSHKDAFLFDRRDISQSISDGFIKNLEDVEMIRTATGIILKSSKSSLFCFKKYDIFVSIYHTTSSLRESWRRVLDRSSSNRPTE